MRTTVQAMAAVLGGTQSLHTNGYDEALSLPTAEAATIALRTQQILAYESGIADVVDPFGGSYAVEALTDAIETRAMELIQKCDDAGGMVAAIEQNIPQRGIEERAYIFQRAVEKKQKILVGTNEFLSASGAAQHPVHKIDPRVEAESAQRLADVRASRASATVATTIAALRACARGTDNLLPPILACAKALCTVGEIADALREEFGQYNQSHREST